MKTFALLLPMTLLVASVAAAQQLDCPGAASRSGDSFHFHVAMYRPDTKGFLDLWGINQFSSQGACERALDTQIKRDLAVVDYFKRIRGENQYEADRFGACHADLSTDKTNPRFLTDAQRVAQLRSAEDLRQRVRERLLDSGITTDSELYRGVTAAVSTPPAAIGGPKLVPVAQSIAVQTPYSASDLRSTKVVEAPKPTLASLDLPLVDPVPGVTPPAAVAAPATKPAPAPAPSGVASTQPNPAAPEPTPAPAVPQLTPAVPQPTPAVPQPTPALPQPTPAAPQPAETAKPAEPAAPQPTAAAAATQEPELSKPAETAEDVADSFIAYETQRIQNVLKASSVIADGEVKTKIYESCMQRIQLLSNLRALIETSGAKSRLAGMTRSVRTEPERLTFVAKLFGEEIRKHWAPADATDVILMPRPDVDNDVDRVLRDTAGHYNDQQKKRALYMFLSHSQPTEDQQMWLTTIADTFLQ